MIGADFTPLRPISEKGFEPMRDEEGADWLAEKVSSMSKVWDWLKFADDSRLPPSDDPAVLSPLETRLIFVCEASDASEANALSLIHI